MQKDTFLNLFFRRYTHFIYNKKFGNGQRFPGWYTTLVFLLFEKLPLRYFKTSGHEGIIRIGFVMNKYIRSVYVFIKPFARIFKMLAKIIYKFSKQLKKVTGIFTRSKKTKIPVTSKTVNFENTVLFQGADYSNEHLFLYFERIRKIKGEYLFFVHLYPFDSPEVVYKDCWPIQPIRLWDRGRIFTQNVYLGDIPKGYYKIKIGIYNKQTFERFKVDGTNDNSVDLGWREIK